MAKSRKTSELLEWFHKAKPSFEGLAKTAESILQNLISKERIPVVSISSRVKNSDSLVEKQRRKRYKEPLKEITDFVGIRVITYTEDDAARVCEVIGRTFSVDSAKSSDKGQQLEVDQIGYRSHHFICDLGEKRIALPEFEVFSGRKFEIQVRTVLQHAWAEVEHDRNYKFSGILPSALQRRLYLISGLLEMGDRELNQLSRDIDAYAANVEQKAREGKLKDEELNTASLPLIVADLVKGLKQAQVNKSAEVDTLATVIEECRAFGVKTASDLKALFGPGFLQALERVGYISNEAGVTRDAMMYADLTKYFETTWQHHWESTDSDSVAVLSSKYGNQVVLAILKDNDVGVMDFHLGDDEGILDEYT